MFVEIAMKPFFSSPTEKSQDMASVSMENAQICVTVTAVDSKFMPARLQDHQNYFRDTLQQ